MPAGNTVATPQRPGFCDEQHITADIETITIQDINGAYERVQKSGIEGRFVIDTASLRDDA